MKRRHPHHYFQLNLDLQGRPCLVVGGDGEALEKTTRLVECGARVTLVARKRLAAFGTLNRAKSLRIRDRAYRPGDERGMYFVINCVKTHPSMSMILYRRCVKQKILISSYDQPRYSTATMAALVRAGQMRIALSSDGAIPGLARKLRIELERVLDRTFVRFADWAAAYRERMVAEGVSPDERRRKLRDLLEGFHLNAICKYPRSFPKRSSSR